MMRAELLCLTVLLTTPAIAQVPDADRVRQEFAAGAQQVGVRLSESQFEAVLARASEQRKDVASVFATTDASQRISTIANYLDAKAAFLGAKDLSANNKMLLSDFSWTYASKEWKGAKFVPLKNDGSFAVELNALESKGMKVNFSPPIKVPAGDAVLTPVLESDKAQALTAFYSNANGNRSGTVMVTGTADILKWQPNLYGRKNRVAISIVATPSGAAWFLNREPRSIPDTEQAYVAPGAYSVRVVKPGFEDYCESNSNVAIDWVVNAVLARKGERVRRGGSCIATK